MLLMMFDDEKDISNYREVAAGVEGQVRRNPRYLQKAGEGREQRNTTVSLAGTACSSPI